MESEVGSCIPNETSLDLNEYQSDEDLPGLKDFPLTVTDTISQSLDSGSDSGSDSIIESDWHLNWLSSEDELTAAITDPTTSTTDPTRLI